MHITCYGSIDLCHATHSHLVVIIVAVLLAVSVLSVFIRTLLLVVVALLPISLSCIAHVGSSIFHHACHFLSKIHHRFFICLCSLARSFFTFSGSGSLLAELLIEFFLAISICHCNLGFTRQRIKFRRSNLLSRHIDIRAVALHFSFLHDAHHFSSALLLSAEAVDVMLLRHV